MGALPPSTAPQESAPSEWESPARAWHLSSATAPDQKTRHGESAKSVQP
jgi:hypothetical protein